MVELAGRAHHRHVAAERAGRVEPKPAGGGMEARGGRRRAQAHRAVRLQAQPAHAAVRSRRSPPARATATAAAPPTRKSPACAMAFPAATSPPSPARPRCVAYSCSAMSTTSAVRRTSRTWSCSLSSLSSLFLMSLLRPPLGRLDALVALELWEHNGCRFNDVKRGTLLVVMVVWLEAKGDCKFATASSQKK